MRQCILLVILFSTGCAAGAREVSWGAEALPIAQKDSEEFYLHRVRYQGETLSLISKWYVGSTDSQILSEVTPGLVERNLQIGDIVLIPAQRLMRREALKKNFIPRVEEKKLVRKQFPAISKDLRFFIARETDPERRALLQELHTDWRSP